MYGVLPDGVEEKGTNKQEYIKVSIDRYNAMLIKNHEYDLVQASVKATLQENNILSSFIYDNGLLEKYKAYKEKLLQDNKQDKA